MHGVFVRLLVFVREVGEGGPEFEEEGEGGACGDDEGGGTQVETPLVVGLAGCEVGERG